MQEKEEQFGVWWAKSTPEAVRRALLTLRQSQWRCRVFYGDVATGKDWNEENETIGYVGSSTGPKPVLLLVHNTRSTGGGAILDDSIVKIVNIATGETVYQHPQYHTDRFYPAEGSDLPEYGATVYQQAMESPAPVAELYARCKTYLQAHRLAAFMNGVRHAK